MSKLSVRVIPNASRSEIAGKESGVWRIRLAAPPIEGRANEALIRFLADKLDLAPSDVDIVRGHSSRTKVVEVPMHAEDVERVLGS